jgi:cyclopropane fatty-acyl-phospholipid synthase-like methyltransferase
MTGVGTGALGRRVPTGDEIRARYPGDAYVGMHAARYASVLSLAAALSLPREPRVLDIGPSVLTILLREQLDVPVDTLGFDSLGYASAGAKHMLFDLNDAQERDRWLVVPDRYDLVVMSEVIEHVHTAPSLVLQFVRSVMVPGGTLLLQTPNAVALGRRARVLIGRNPYNLINEDTTNPLHFREYTQNEMLDYLTDAGFIVRRCERVNLLDGRYVPHKSRVAGSVQYAVGKVLPSQLRSSISAVATA